MIIAKETITKRVSSLNLLIDQVSLSNDLMELPAISSPKTKRDEPKITYFRALEFSRTCFRIDYCTPQDLDKVQEIENLSFRHPFSPSLFVELLIKFPMGFRIAFSGGRVVGYYILTESDKKKVTPVLCIASIAVHPEFRRRGIGSALLRDIFSNARRNFPSAKQLELQVAVQNLPARSLYSKFGFEEKRIIVDYYGPREDAILMERSL